MKRIKAFFGWLRSCISPGYVAMLVAAFVLWYITKLGYTYTTDQEVTIVVDGGEYDVDCTIRGKGTDLIGYAVRSHRSVFEIGVDELTFDGESINDEGVRYRHISSLSLQQVLASRMSDVEVVAVGATPNIEVKPALIEANDK